MSHWRVSTKKMAEFVLPCMVMVLPIKDKFLKHIIWRNCGNYLVYSFVKIMVMVSFCIYSPCSLHCRSCFEGMGTSAERASANIDYYTRGDVIPGIWVDGMDVLAVKSATKFAIDFVNKNGPLVMEMFTYRYSGHSMSDPGTSYRTREEIQEVRAKRDPIASFKERILETGLLNQEEVKVRYLIQT